MWQIFNKVDILDNLKFLIENSRSVMEYNDFNITDFIEQVKLIESKITIKDIKIKDNEVVLNAIIQGEVCQKRWII